MILRIDHIALAVRDHEKAEKFFQELFGAIPGTFAEDPRMRYVWKNYALGDLSRFELLWPTGSGSFLDSFLENREGGVHHITMQTPDIQMARRTLEEKGIPYFGYNEYVGGVWKELFIHPRDAFGVLIQLAEFTPDDWLADAVKFPSGTRWQIERREGGADLIVAHPGGGKVRIGLSKEDVGQLLKDLESCL